MSVTNGQTQYLYPNFIFTIVFIIYTVSFSIQEYMGKVLAHLEKTKPDRIADFKANAKVAIKKVSSSL